MKIEDLRVNQVREPLGFSAAPLSFSWKVREAIEGDELLSARLTVQRQRDGKVVYESREGETLNPLDTEIPFTPEARTRYLFRIAAWTKAGEAAEAESWFETGKMKEPWEAEWICSRLRKEEGAPPVFEKCFSLSRVPECARLYLCGLGVYEVFVNGEKAGKEYLAPGYHSYDLHLQVQTIDVTELLRVGENHLAVFLGDGWFQGRIGFDGGYTDVYGDNAYLIAELYCDGELTVKTDGSFRERRSPVVFSNIYDGEVFDAHLLRGVFSPEEPGWEAAKTKAPEGCGTLCDRMSLPVVAKETFPVRETIRTPKGETVLDFGQEVTGWLTFYSTLPEGFAVCLTASEILQDGCFFRENYRTAKAEFTYISDGEARQVRPHHTFYCFRYVKVEIMDASGEEMTHPPLELLGEIRAVHLRSDFDEIGALSSGNPRVDRLIQNVFWGQKDNFLDVPTDCPQRDERLGWTGDAQIFSDTACLNMDMGAFYRKYLWDMRAEQSLLEGSVPNVVPRLKREMIGEAGSCPWADAGVVIPWNVYRSTGSLSLLREFYPGMKAWVDYERIHKVYEGGFHFADWLALDNPEHPGPFGATDPLYIASAYFYRNLCQVTEAAERLSYGEDTRKYRALSEEILEKLRQQYFGQDGICRIQTQTAAALALTFGLCDGEVAAKKQAEALAELVHGAGDHLNTGFVGTKELLPALSENGYHDLAVTLLLKRDYPSWLYAVDLGATTIWERWDSVKPDGHLNDDGMNSLNHYSYGSVAGWMYRYLGGIRETEPGYRKAKVMPLTDLRLPEFTASVDTAAGRYRSHWKQNTDGTYSYEVQIPFGCEAEVILGSHRENVRGEAIVRYTG